VRKGSLSLIGFLFILGNLSVKGQISVSMGYGQSTVAVNKEVPITFAYPSANGFSTFDFSKQFPASKIISEEIKVNFPTMSEAVDTAGILWYLKPENYSAKGEVNIIIIGISADSIKTFYVDNNNDRTFADNEDKFRFKPEDEKRILEIKILGAYSNYTILNPDYKVPATPPSRTKEYYAEWHLHAKKPSVNIDFSFLGGGGDAYLAFDPLTGPIDTYKYFANITGCLRPSVGIDFSWHNVHMLLSGSFERLQYDETVRYGYNDNVTKPTRNYNSGIWNTLKLHAGVSVEYDLGLFRKLWITPLWSYYISKNSDNPVFDRSFYPPANAEYQDMHSTEYGMKLKVPTSERGIIYIKGSYIESWFDASEFLPEYDPASYTVDYHQVFFGVGFQYRLVKK
jgi:hypothetical protein